MAFVSNATASTVARTPGSVVKVEKEKSTQVATENRDRISLTLTNDSENVIYVFKGEGAKVGEGVRLNANGGALVIDDYTGIVTAAAATAASNLCVSEV